MLRKIAVKETVLLVSFILISASYACKMNGAGVESFTEKENKETVISVAGDIMLSRGVQPKLEKFGYDYPYEQIKELFLTDDLTIVNLECPITEAENPVSKPSNLIFKADLENAEALKRNGIDCIDLANNHSMDYRADGLGETMDVLETVGIATVGAGRNADDDFTQIFEINGLRIGVLAFTEFSTEGFFYNANEPCFDLVTEYNLDSVAKRIEEFDCDFKIVYFHWGIEYEGAHSDRQELFAHRAVESGANFVVGSHPHVLQDTEIYKGVPIYYSLGNFVFDRQVPFHTDETAVLQITVDEDGLAKTEFIPCRIENCAVVPDGEHVITKF